MGTVKQWDDLFYLFNNQEPLIISFHTKFDTLIVVVEKPSCFP